MSIVKLGHVELRVTDLDRSVGFYNEVMGLTVTSEQGGTAHLRAGGSHHDLTLTQADRAGLEHYAWRVGAPDELDSYEKLLSGKGFDTARFDGEDGQDVGLRFTDPAGMTCELYWEMEKVGKRISGRGIAPERPSHIVFATSAVDEMVSFYRDVFGFMVSDEIVAPDGMLIGCFMRNNPEHHSLAVLRAPIPGALHHVAWYVPTFDGLKRAADILSATDNPIEYGPGRHGIGENTYLYFRDPDTMRMEATGEMLFLPDPDYEPCVWKAEEFGKAVSAWGAAPPESFMTEAV